MSGWNFAELWERIADKFPDATAQVQGDRRLSWARVRPPGRRAGRARSSTPAPATRTRWRSTSTTRPSTSRRRSPASRPASSRSTPTTATSTTSSSTCGTTPTPSPSCSTAPSPTVVEPIRATAAEGPDLAVGRRRRRRRARRGPMPYEAVVDAADRRASSAPQPRDRRRHPDDLHRRHHRHAEGRDVAPGRPDPCHVRDRAARSCCRTPRTSAATTRCSSTLAAPGLARPARLPADARHRLVHRQHLPVPGGLGRLARRPQASTSIELLDTIEREGVGALTIVGDAFAKPIAAARSTPSPAAGTSRRSC